MVKITALRKIIAVFVATAIVITALMMFPAPQVSAETLVDNTFDVNYDGWYSAGDYTDITAVAGGYDSARAMYVSGRQANVDGAMSEKGFYLDGGITYNYSVWVKAVNADEEFTLTLRYLYPDETYGASPVATVKAKQGEWVKLEGSYKAPDGTVNLTPIINTDSTNDFYFDEFVVTEKKKKLFSVSAAMGDDGLKDVYANYFRIGGCMSGNGVNNNTVKAVAIQHYNSITPENELKPNSTVDINNSSGNNVAARINDVSAMMEFCIQNNIAMRGHVLAWHAQSPPAFFKQNFNVNGGEASKADMIARFDSYVENLFKLIKTRYPELNLYAYDVVNEALLDSGTYNGNWQDYHRVAGYDGQPGQPGQSSGGSPWMFAFGDNSFIVDCFEIAAKHRDTYYPDLKLFYNDYNEYMGSKHVAMVDLAKDLYARGTLDGVGMQSHVGTWPPLNEYLSAMDNFLEIGCEVQLTELDFGHPNASDAAAYCKGIFQHAVEKVKEGKPLTAIVVWGSLQNLSWIANNGGAAVVLFDSNGNGNGNYTAVAGEAIIPKSEWGDGDNPAVGDFEPPPPPEPDENGYFFYDTFEDDNGSWGPRGDSTTAIESVSLKGSKSLGVTGRTDTWMGAGKSLNSRAFVPGGTYAFGGAVMAEVDTNWQMSVYYTLSGEDVYATIDTASSKAGEWAILEGTLEIPTGAGGMLFYFETEYTAEDETLTANLTDFYLDEAYGGIEGATSPFGDITPPETEPTTTTSKTTSATTTKTTNATTSRTTKQTDPPQGGVEMERPGDLDLNGLVELSDIVMLCQCIAAVDMLDVVDEQGLANANVYADDVVDSTDLSVFANAMVNSKLGSLPVKP